MIFDIILIILFLAAVSRGWHRGFIKAVFSFLTYLIAFIIAFSARGAIANWLMQLPFAQNVSDWVSSTASSAVGEASKLPFISDGIMSQANNLTYFIMQVLAILFVFIIVAIILSFVARILTGIIKFVQLGFINNILGGVLGAINGYIIVYFVALAAFALSGCFPWIASAMTGSNIAHDLPNPITLLKYFWGIIT